MSFGKRQTKGHNGPERRRHHRETTSVAGHILLPSGEVRCRVVDVSDRGARLTVATAFGLPDAFEFRAGGRTFRVRVTRRASGCIGVVFQ
jgi:hypothetical protein